jgi:hypothetical protein
MATFLVVANQTAGGDELLSVVLQLIEGGPHQFHLVAPASPARDHLRWTEGDAYLLARENLEKGLARLFEVGASATGNIGDANPMLAIEDALRQHRADALVISTFDERRSIWLRHNLAERAAARFGLPVIHVAPDANAGTSPKLIFLGGAERLLGSPQPAPRAPGGDFSLATRPDIGRRNRFNDEVVHLRTLLTSSSSRSTLRAHLLAVKATFAAHVTDTEADDGSFAELVSNAPRLSHRVDALRREHALIATSIDDAIARLDEHSIERGPSAEPDGEQRRELTEISRQLDMYLHRGLELYHEAFSVDLHGE